MSPRSTQLRLVVILTVTLFAYVGSMWNGFTMDDHVIAKARYKDGRENPMVSTLRPASDYFESHYWRGHRAASNLYRPVTVWTYAIVNAIASAESDEGQAWPQHAVNVLLHVLATWLAYLLIRGLTGSATPALVGSLVFGLHALHSEVVAGIAGRAELLAFGFGAAAAVMHARQLATDGWRRAAWSLGTGVALFASLCSKESGLGWAPMAILLWCARERRLPRDPGNLLWTAIAMVIPIATYAWLRHHALSGLDTPHTVAYLVNPLAHVSTAERVRTGTMIFGYGLYKTAFPFSLASAYGASFFPILQSWVDWRFVVSAIAIAAIAAAGLLAVRRHPLLLVGVAMLLTFFIPVSNVAFAIGTIFGERLLFTPSLGFACVVAWWFARSPQSEVTRKVTRVCTAAWLIASLATVVLRVPDWKDDPTLFVHDAQAQPTVARLLVGAGVCTPDEEERAHLYRRALAVYPEYVNAAKNLAAYHFARRETAESERLLRQALASPHLDHAREAFDIHYGLLPILFMTKRAPEGLAQFEQAMAVARPSDWPRLQQAAGNVAGAGLRAEARRMLRRLSEHPRTPGEVRAAVRRQLERLR